MTDYYCDNCEFFEDKSTDKLIDGYCKKYNQSLNFYDWWEKCDNCVIETLKAENASLKERLGKAVELPRIEQSPYNGMFNGQTINDDTLLYYIEDGHIKQECFNNKFPEQLQKRLAELKGEKK